MSIYAIKDGIYRMIINGLPCLTSVPMSLLPEKTEGYWHLTLDKLKIFAAS
jgi:hypothetical protein